MLSLVFYNKSNYHVVSVGFEMISRSNNSKGFTEIVHLKYKV